MIAQWIANLFSPRAATVEVMGHPASGVIGWLGGSASSSGIVVTDETALNFAPVWAATKLLSSTIGCLPLNLMLGEQRGGRKIARQHPVFRLIHDRPNPLMPSSAFRCMMLIHQINAGNAYAEIERNMAGEPLALWPIHPSRVRVVRDGNTLTYLVHNNNGFKTPLDPSEMLHVRSTMSDDGIVGKGVVAAARETIGAGLAAERTAGKTFENGAAPRVVLTHPKNLSKDARANMREEWHQLYGGTENTGKTAILQEGTDLKVLNVSFEDAQFLQTRQFEVTEIARWYNIPPHMIQDLSRSTNNNIEEQGRDFVRYSLTPWIVPWEDELDAKLLSEDERGEGYYTHHAVDELQRGNAQARASANEIKFRNGVINEDEWRAEDDQEPLPNDLGKRFYIQSSLVEVGKEPEPEPVDPEMPVSEGAAKPVEGGAKAYSDDQPRDESGRFGEGGGGGGGDSDDDDSEEEDDSDEEDAEAEALQESRDTEDSERQDARDQEDSDQIDADAEEDSAIEDARSEEDSELEDARSQEDSDRDDARQATRDSEDEARQEARDAEDADLESRHEAEMDAKRDSLHQERRAEDRQRDADRDAEISKENADFNAEQAPLKKEFDELPDELDESQQARADEIGEELEKIEEKWNAIQEKREAREEKDDEKREAAREKEDEKLEERGAKELEKAQEKLEKSREKEDEKIQKSRDKEDEKGDPELDKAREKQDAEIAARREKEDAKREKDREQRNAAREKAREEEDRQIEDRRKREDSGQPVASKPRLVIVAARTCFSDAFSRMVRVEQNAARSAAKKSGKWFPWLDEFYGRHEQAMVAALEHPGNVLIALGQPCDVPAICKAHCKESYDLLLAASDAKPDQFEAAVETLVAGWAERATIHGRTVAHV